MTRIEDLDTPAVVVLLDRLEDNITRVQGMISSHGLLNRPHIKTTKFQLLANFR